MKLLGSLGLIGLTAAGSNDELARSVGGSRVCGEFSGNSVSIQSEMELEPNSGCIFKWHPESDVGIVQLTLQEDIVPLCSKQKMYIVVDGEIHGPFCENDIKRKRRHDDEDGSILKKEYSYSSSESSGKEVDVVYTNDGGFRFRFNFNFEFELLPGKPGEYAQDGLYTQVYFDTENFLMKFFQVPKMINTSDFGTRIPENISIFHL